MREKPVAARILFNDGFLKSGEQSQDKNNLIVNNSIFGHRLSINSM